MVRKIPNITLVTAGVLLVLTLVIPADILEKIIGDSMHPFGMVTVFINPILGMIGSVASFRSKQWVYLILNLLLAVSFILTLLISLFVYQY